LNHQGHEDVDAGTESLAGNIVDAGLKVHRALGPGLLESAYEHCLAHELALRGIPVSRQVAQPIRYEGEAIDVGYRLDLVVDKRVAVEVKAVEALAPIHQAQLLTYLKLSGLARLSDELQRGPVQAGSQAGGVVKSELTTKDTKGTKKVDARLRRENTPSCSSCPWW
jgi:GxxExxY protein